MTQAHMAERALDDIVTANLQPMQDLALEVELDLAAIAPELAGVATLPAVQQNILTGAFDVQGCRERRARNVSRWDEIG
jgi:hypothetical protein